MGGRGWRVPARNPGASFAPLSPAPATNAVKDFHAVNYCDSAMKWPPHVAVGETHGRAEPD